MKEKMVRHNIPTAKYIRVRDIKEFDNIELTFPVIVKPTDSNSSKGVRKAFDASQLKRFLKDALRISRNGEAIIEEFKEGIELGIDCFIVNGKANIIMTKERRKIIAIKNSVQQIYGCIWPADLSEGILCNFRKIADQIAAAFNLDNTPLMLQVIVNGSDINVIEFAPRIGGGESFRIIELSTGFNIVNAAVDSFLGTQVQLDYKPPQIYYADNFIYAKSGLFGNILGYENLLNKGVLEYLDKYKTPGAEIGEELSSNNRVGVFTVKSENRNELFYKIDTVIENIEVYNFSGGPIMRKDIYRQDK